MIKNMSKERKQYLKKIKRRKYLVFLTQLSILIIFLGVWEILADKKVIDSFITSQPSRILDTLVHLGSNDLLKHIGVTVYETIVGFLIGAIMGIIIAIILWWSDFLSRVSEPYLVVLNSLPKVALRTYYYYMGWSRYFCNYYNGNFNFVDCHNIGKSKWIFKNR